MNKMNKADKVRLLNGIAKKELIINSLDPRPQLVSIETPQGITYKVDGVKVRKKEFEAVGAIPRKPELTMLNIKVISSGIPPATSEREWIEPDLS